MDVPLYAYSLQERSSVPSPAAEYTCETNQHGMYEGDNQPMSTTVRMVLLVDNDNVAQKGLAAPSLHA